MKKYISKIILLCFLTTGLGVSVYAQEGKNKPADKTKAVKSQQSMSSAFEANKDYVVMFDNRTYWRKNGSLMLLENDLMIEGMRITAAGKITKRDGSQITLKNGEALSVTDGLIITVDENKIHRERINELDSQNKSLKETSREIEEGMAKLNQRMNLLIKKTDLLNEKMTLMNQDLDKSLKLSKEEMQQRRDRIKNINEEILNTDAKLKEIEEHTSRNVPDAMQDK